MWGGAADTVMHLITCKSGNKEGVSETEMVLKLYI